MAGLPLEGVRVADFTWIIAGPYGTYLLARMGAEVIKIEGLQVLDHTRENPPHAGGVRGLNRSGFFNSINADKKSVTLQLSDPAHAAIAKQIVAKSDVAIEAFSRGTMARFGLGYEELRATKPDLIMLSCTGFGQTGRDAALRAFMGTVHAYTGLNSTNGYAGGPPKATGGTWADYISGVTLVFAVLAALRHRRRTGCGQHIDLSMSDAVLSTMGASFIEYFMNGRIAAPRGNTSEYAAPNNVYRCAGEDAWCAVSVENDAQWDALRLAIGDAELDRAEYGGLGGRKQHAASIDARIAAWARERTPLEATETLQRAGVPAGPSSCAGELFEQPQLRARGFFVAPDHAEVGPRAIPNLPWRLGRAADTSCEPAPLLGQHNDEVLGELLGLPRDVIDAINAQRDDVLRRFAAGSA
jgi:benzylsuccinate CoA-transferase BbsF subunit